MAGYSVTFSVVDNATRQIDQINRRLAQMRAPIERMQRSFAKFVDVSGLRRVAEGFNWVARAAQSALRSMVQIVPVLGTITGAATIAGMVKLVSSFAAWSRELETNADRIGVSTQTLQKFQDATRLAGGNAEDMTEALKGVTDSLRDAFLKGGEAAAAYNQLKIAIRDGNGHIRNAAEVLPELIEKINAMKDPADRARFAQLLLGGSGEKLAETFRTSTRSLSDYLEQAAKLPGLTDEQRNALHRFNDAQNALGVTFDHLGQQISATLAKNFNPLLERLNDFVQKHTPEIIAAVDRISGKFAAWLEGIDWTKVQEGADKLLDGLKWIVDNLDSIAKAAELIAGIFVAKWGVQAVAAVAQLTAALGSAGASTAGAVMGGVGLLGALASIAAIASVLVLKGDTAPLSPEDKAKLDERNRQEEEDYRRRHNLAPGADPAGAINQQQGYTGSFWHDLGVGISSAAGAIGRRIMGGPESIRRGGGSTNFEPTAKDITPEGRGLLKTIAGGESKGDYNVLYGGGHFTGDQFPQWEGRDNSHAAGAYQFQPGTFRGVQREHPEIADFRPENQDKAAWFLAQQDYNRRTGRDLQADLKDPMQAERIARTLQPTWTSTSNQGWSRDLQTNVAKAQAAATPPRAGAPAATAAGAPAAAPASAPGAAPNGQVQINITHENPPPGTTLGATASGNGLKLDPPRTEQASLWSP